MKSRWMRESRKTAILILLMGTAAAKPPAQIAVYLPNVCKEWSAWYNAQAAGPKTLNVVGVCTFHASGYVVKITRRKSPNTKGESCILDLSIKAPTGIAGIERGIRHISARYSEQTEQPCDTVLIEPDLTVPVQPIR